MLRTRPITLASISYFRLLAMPRRKYWRKSEARKSAASSSATLDGGDGNLTSPATPSAPDVGPAVPAAVLSDSGLANPLPSSVSDDGLSVSMGVSELSDGGLAQPSPSSTVLDDGPSVPVGVLNLSDGGLSPPAKTICVLNLPENCHDIMLEPCQKTTLNTLQTNDLQQDSQALHMHTPEFEQLYSEIEFTATPLYDEAFKANATSLRGPYNTESFLLGSFNQSDVLFNDSSRGSQCTVNALCSLIHAHYLPLNTQQSLDNILIDGDHLYNQAIHGLRERGTLRSKLLTFDEIPRTVSLLNKDITVQKCDVISGVCTQQFATMHLPSLYQTVYSAFQTSSYLLFMIGSVCSALFRKDDEYYIFDSHSHGQDGLSAPDGKSLLASFSCLEDLVTFMYALYDSMLIDLTAQFDMLPVKLIETEKEYDTDKLIRNESISPCKRRPSEQDEWQTVSYKRQKKSSSDACDMSGSTMKSVTASKMSSKQVPSKSTANESPTLIGQYFKDQKRRNEYKKQIKKESNRTEYHRLYKQRQRESLEIKKKDKAYTLSCMTKFRQSGEFRQHERESKRNSRECSEIKKKDQASTLSYMSKARQSDEFRQHERESKRKSRECPEIKEKDQASTLSYKRKARQSDDFRQHERESKRKSRECPEIKKKDQASTLSYKSKARQSDEFRQKEKASKRRARLIKQYREWETEQKRQKRSQTTYKQKELEKQRLSKQKARQDIHTLEKERLIKQHWRSNERNKKAEQALECNRKALKRKDPVNVENEQIASKRRKFGTDMKSCIELFHKNISIGPVYVCSCCQQTWFRQSVSSIISLNGEQKDKYLTCMKSAGNEEWICTTCKRNILSGKVPKLSIVNGMNWPDKPKELDIFPLEERLISLRIPFMQMRELPRGRQLSVKGNVINVPVEIQPVVDALPRPFDENVTVPVKLKKKMSFKSCAFTENVRPLRVLVALHWLMNHSKLYKNANVHIDEDWINNVTNSCNEVVHEFLSSNTKINEETTSIDDPISNETCQTPISVETMPITEEQSGSDVEDSLEDNVGSLDTLLDDANVENRNTTLTFAPGEGQQPLSIYQDLNSEYLCFPSIFCGQSRKENDERIVPVHYSDIAKWELRSQDRRAANSVPNIFFKLKKLQMKQLNDKVNLAIRRCQTGQSMTAEQARDVSCTNNMVKKDEGYYIFKQIRNSPAYLETRKRDVFAMIRQLGLPTWFMSLSSADTKWIDLLKMLATLNQKVDYSDEQIANLTWEQKTKLIQSDPVTCARYFDHRVQTFISVVLNSDHEPLGKLTDYFYRVEFQQRGSPHIHMIAWVENSPKFNVNTNEEIASYVDKFIQCSLDDQDVQHLTEIQVHKHSRTCRKKEDKICRFGYPLPPLPYTMVLDPLETDKEKYYKLYTQLQKTMNAEKDGYHMNYDNFLKNVVQMSENEYIKCIRSSLNSSKVFLKRKPSEIRVNLYNKDVLYAWKANIDIQFVLDPYACAMYIVSYISKSQRGMSNLLYAAAKEARDGNLDIKRQVRHIGNVFSNSVEVSAQEAVYLILQMPLTNSTRDVVFINTSTADKRVQLLKPKSVLDDLPANSTEIMSDNIIKRYSRRPKALENWCLADYVSQLDIIYPNENEHKVDEDQNDDTITDMDIDQEFDETQTILTLRSGIKIRRRSKFKVIRYVRFNLKSDEENHYREKLLLFLPWRNEETDLLRNFTTYKAHFNSIQHMIDCKCKEYEHHMEELEQARNLAEADHEAYDELAPATQQEEADTAEEAPVESESFVYFNPDRAVEHRQYDIGIEIGCSVSAPRIDTNEKLLKEDDYRELLRSLNTKQRQFYNHVVHWIKTKSSPLYAFLSGGAGVGKSVVIRALYQTLFRFLNLKEGENTDDIRVLLCAYTGKAAFNINGSTICSAFKQKYKQSDQTLTCDNLNTFRCKYKDLSVVIIDEISMVSNAMLSFINQRLQELTGSRVPFGGVSIIAVGDLYQLKPVSGDWIFNDLTRDATSLASNLWKEHFHIFELTEIMRQKDDMEFAELLNRLRQNSLTDEDWVKLRKCEKKNCDPDYQLNAPHLFAENYFMHIFNETIINSMQSEKHTIPCHDSVVSPKLSKQKQDDSIRKLPTDPNKTSNLHCSLTIVVGMIYDLTVNINTEDGLANGASCVVKFVEFRQVETSRPSIIWVQFDDVKAGNETRIKYRNRGLYNEDINENWTPIFDIERSFTYNRKTFQRIQFPLQPSAGRSVHRAQGSTLEKVVIDLSQRKTRKVPHLHYVALSRVKSLKTLQILNLNVEALKVDEQVKMEMARLHDAAILQLCYNPLDSVSSLTHFKLAFNNCRSLNLHF